MKIPRKLQTIRIPDSLTGEARKRYEEYNARQLERQRRHQERLAKRKAERKLRHEAEKADALKAMEQIRVGSVFSASWGYEQTNVNFFQVVALAGKTSVRVREVTPPIVARREGMMCGDYTYDIPGDGTLLPAVDRSVFIKDQVNGDVKRIQTYSRDYKPIFRLTSYASASLEQPGHSTHYESWYA